jgi:hypothetical protein
MTVCALLAACFCGCRPLQPRPIGVVRNNLPNNLTRDGELQVERGVPRPVIDATGWIFGIPSKLMFWNRKIENHSISTETEVALTEYLKANGLDEVKVRLNQYRPLDDWSRLTRNQSIAWPWRYTFGTVSLLGETFLPGRLFGGDHFNPYTSTIHLYSDLPSIALHEGAHAKDFSNHRFPGTYAALYTLPLVPLWHEREATNDVLSYADWKNDDSLRHEVREVLYPAYGTYVGNAAGYGLPKYSLPVYAAGVIAGHALGRWESSNIY